MTNCDSLFAKAMILSLYFLVFFIPIYFGESNVFLTSDKVNIASRIELTNAWGGVDWPMHGRGGFPFFMLILFGYFLIQSYLVHFTTLNLFLFCSLIFFPLYWFELPDYFCLEIWHHPLIQTFSCTHMQQYIQLPRLLCCIPLFSVNRSSHFP